jgi:cbb3-type cytochrome oxidase maturation protein
MIGSILSVTYVTQKNYSTLFLKYDDSHFLNIISVLFMSVIYVLLAISTLVAVFFFVLFIFSVKKGQYDDSYTPSVRMLFDDELVDEDSESDEKPVNETQ